MTQRPVNRTINKINYIFTPAFMIKVVVIIFILILLLQAAPADSTLATIRIQETSGLNRENDYVEIPLQLNYLPADTDHYEAVDEQGNRIFCQAIVYTGSPENKSTQLSLIFPISLTANSSKLILLKKSAAEKIQPMCSDLRINGAATELIVDNSYYRADLTRSSESEGKDHLSGQLRELLIKMNKNQLLFRHENRMHWAPNFQKQGAVEYKTIAQWDNPAYNRIDQGPYLIKTTRQAPAPDNPEVMLTAVYKFYAGKPYFIFYSAMEIRQNVTLLLLRNDEMTMDSMFTHIAFKRPDGRIENMAFTERTKYLTTDPVENEAPWICFYNRVNQFGFGSIRLKYENENSCGDPSPLFMPHTKISDGAAGGKYWNRRLIHDHPTFVPAGSRYIEENAYIVFSGDQGDPFKDLEYWSNRLRNPLIWKIIGTTGNPY